MLDAVVTTPPLDRLESSDRIAAKEYFVFSDNVSQLYHFTVEGHQLKDGVRIPPEVHCSINFSCYFPPTLEIFYDFIFFPTILSFPGSPGLQIFINAEKCPNIGNNRQRIGPKKIKNKMRKDNCEKKKSQRMAGN